jgi:hypothetical protein
MPTRIASQETPRQAGAPADMTGFEEAGENPQAES